MLLGALGFAACAAGAQGGDLDDYLLSLPELAVQPVRPKTEVPCAGKCPMPDDVGAYQCSYRRYEETAQYDHFVALQPGSATLWPGTVVRGADAEHGVLTPVGVELAPVTFSVSLENIAASPVATMDRPSLSAFRAARNQILAGGVTGATAAALDFQVEKVSSESQLAVALGASASWPGGADIAASFDFGSSSLKTKMLVNFTQSYYTVDVDTPASPAKFFAEGTTRADLEPWVDAASPPLYVQSISYGRRVIFAVQTDATAEEVKSALEAAYNGIAVNAGVSVSALHKEVLRQSTIRAFVLGGSGSDAAAVIDGFEGLASYIKKGGSYSKDSPGAPIAYKLAYLDNAVAKLAFTTDYAERVCTRDKAGLHVQLQRLDHLGGGDSGDNIEIFGAVRVRYPTKGSPVVDCNHGGKVATVWSLPLGSWVSFPEKSSYTPKSAFIDLHDVPISDGSRICISGDFWEEDGDTGEGSADDDFGIAGKILDIRDGWAGEHTVVTHGDNDNSIAAVVRVTLSE
jgi:thiol-activated cytolysin